MIRLFTKKEFLAPGAVHVDLLEPFWGKLPEFGVAKGMNRNAIYSTIAHDFFLISEDIQASDYMLLPSDYKFYKKTPKLIDDLETISKQSQKKIIVFSHSDRYHAVRFKNAIVFRSSAYKSLSLSGRDFALPFSFGDLLSYYSGGKVVEKVKGDVPVIGFCGNVKKGRVKAIAKRFLLGAKDGFDCMRLRKKALNVLSTSPEVKANFVLRDKHFAGAAFGSGIEGVREQFYQNLLESDYVLALRGNGNYSYRFYEILQSGRIPFFINTDCDFPFDEEVRILDQIPWIDHRDIQKAPEYIAQYHHALTGGQFLEKQQAMRNIWEKWYSNHGFFKQLHNVLGK